MYEANRELAKDDRRWFFVFADTFYLETLSPWAQTLDSYTLFRELGAFLQQSLDPNQLLLALRALANLDEMQLEAKQYLDVDQLILALRVSANPDKLQLQAKSISNISARSLDQQNSFCSKVSMNNDLLSKFDSILKKLPFDKSKTISRHIHPIALSVARSNTKFFSPYVQDMLYWSSRDFNISHHSKHSRIRDYWLKRFTKGLSHQDTLNEIKVMKGRNANDNRRFL